MDDGCESCSQFLLGNFSFNNIVGTAKAYDGHNEGGEILASLIIQSHFDG